MGRGALRLELNGLPPKKSVSIAAAACWGNSEHICNEIAALNRFIDQHPCFAADAQISASQLGNCLVVQRQNPTQTDAVVYVLVNPTDQTRSIALNTEMLNSLGDNWQTLYGDAPRQNNVPDHLQLSSWQLGPWQCCVIGQPLNASGAATGAPPQSANNRNVLARLIASRYAPEDVYLAESDWQWAIAEPLTFLQHFSTYSHDVLDQRLRKETPGRAAVVVWQAANDSQRTRLWPACDYLVVQHKHCPTLTLHQATEPSCLKSNGQTGPTTWQGEWLWCPASQQWLGVFLNAPMICNADRSRLRSSISILPSRTVAVPLLNVFRCCGCQQTSPLHRPLAPGRRHCVACF